MKVLVGCEFSQRVTKAFRERGHEAYSCDVIDTEGNPDWHINDDVRNVISSETWDLVILHPPCTYLANSGVKWLYNGGNKANGVNVNRWNEMIKASEFFFDMLNAKCERVCVENPIQHGYVGEVLKKLNIERKSNTNIEFTQSIQPWQFGEGKTKRTCLWLKNLPRLKPTNVVSGREHAVHNEPPSPNRQKNRSRTYNGIAQAMAEQWG